MCRRGSRRSWASAWTVQRDVRLVLAPQSFFERAILFTQRLELAAPRVRGGLALTKDRRTVILLCAAK